MDLSPDLSRCQWAGTAHSIEYHDKEWGVPVHDDRLLFEFLVLEGAQAGLSWETILRKRAGYRQAFDNFEPVLVAAYAQLKVEELLSNAGIVRNQRKILSAIQNARAFLDIQHAYTSFDTYIWQFVGGKPRHNSWTSIRELPARTVESDVMSRDLKRHGFSFVGSTICYAFMQATGMVNDHEISCFRYAQLKEV